MLFLWTGLTLAWYFFRNLFKLCSLLFRIAFLLKTFTSFASFADEILLLLNTSSRPRAPFLNLWAPLDSESENVSPSCTILTKTITSIKAKDKMKANFILLCCDSPRNKTLLSVYSIPSALLAFWCAGMYLNLLFPVILFYVTRVDPCVPPTMTQLYCFVKLIPFSSVLSELREELTNTI